ncbi:hypothetical protein ABK040_006778 [Willaertia magna]
MSLKHSLALTSWFRILEQGMMEFEVLSRSSATLIKGSNNKVHVLTSAHVTHPFIWRRYYPGEQYDWLEFVKEEHVKCKLDIRDPKTGIPTATFKLKNRMFLPDDTNLDISLLHLESMNDLKDLENYGIVPLELKETDLQGEENVEFFGHRAEGDELLLPQSIKGKIKGFADNKLLGIERVFAKTDIPCQQGMCGGPCLDQENPNTCVGVLEGIVNPTSSLEQLRNHAAVIPTHRILQFIRKVEQEM